MKEVSRPPCSNNRRTSMKCRRMCCRKPKPKPIATGRQQRLMPLPTRHYDLAKVREQQKQASHLSWLNRRK
jgi:hypothetical protein